MTTKDYWMQLHILYCVGSFSEQDSAYTAGCVPRPFHWRQSYCKWPKLEVGKATFHLTLLPWTKLAFVPRLGGGTWTRLGLNMAQDFVEVMCVTAKYWPNFLPSSLLAMVKAGKCLSVAFLASAELYELGPGPFTEPSETTQYYCTTSLALAILYSIKTL